MKKLFIILALIGLASAGPVKVARTPKDVATTGANSAMRQTNNPPVLVPMVKSSVIATNRPPRRAPWVVAKSFQFDRVVGAFGYYVMISTNQVDWTGRFDLGTNTVFTFTNLPPRRPMWFQVIAYDPQMRESLASAPVGFMQVSFSSWIDSSGQHFVYNVPPGHVVDVDSERQLNGAKFHVGTFTNINVLLLTEPLMSQNSYIVTAR